MTFAQKVGVLMTKLRGIVKGRRSLKYYTRFKFWSTRNERGQTSTAIQHEINLTKVINLAGNNKKSLHRLGLCDEKQQEEKNLGGISWPRNNPGLPAPQEACKTHQIRYFLQIHRLASSAWKMVKLQQKQFWPLVLEILEFRLEQA